MQGLVLPWGWEETGAALEGCSQGRGMPSARALACGDWALQSWDSPVQMGGMRKVGFVPFPCLISPTIKQGAVMTREEGERAVWKAL